MMPSPEWWKENWHYLHVYKEILRSNYQYLSNYLDSGDQFDTNLSLPQITSITISYTQKQIRNKYGVSNLGCNDGKFCGFGLFLLTLNIN